MIGKHNQAGAESQKRSMEVPMLQIAFAVMFAAFSAAAPALGSASVAQPQGQVEGEVLQVSPTVVVIKSEQGHATILQLSAHTQMKGTFKPGDKVVAYVTPYEVSSLELKPLTASAP